MPTDNADHLESVFGAQVRPVAAQIARGVFWTRAFLNAGPAGGQLASRFLDGREGLPEQVITEFEHLEHPTVIGASGRNGAFRLLQWAGVQTAISELDDPDLKLAGQLGRALDVSDDLIAELKSWLQVEEADHLAAQLGPQAFRRLASIDESIKLDSYDTSREISFDLNDF